MGLAVLIATAYALGSMALGGMLVLAHLSGGYTFTILWGNALGLQNWNYPLLLIEAPWGFVVLPFFATLSMVLVSVGVGLGMAVAILLGVQLIREHRVSTARPAATGAVAGLTPAMIALVTLGACCSTTAVATGGVGLVAQASGSSSANLLLNNWYLGVFQVVVVYVALIAQELLLSIYGSLFGKNDPRFVDSTEPSRPLNGRAVATAALRAGLLAAGVTWALAVVATWTTTDPMNASAGLWFNWLFEHWLVGGLAIATALSPSTARSWTGAFGSAVPRFLARAMLFASAFALGLWVPPPLAGAGVEGLGNEVLGSLGFPGPFGAVAPAYPWGLVLALRWGFQYILLAGFAGAVALSPERVLHWMTEDAPALRPATAASAVAPTTAAIRSNAR